MLTFRVSVAIALATLPPAAVVASDRTTYLIDDFEGPAALQCWRFESKPGSRVDSARQIIAEVGAAATTFAAEKHLASWVGVCLEEEESAGVSASNRSPKGNRFLRRLLNLAAVAAAPRFQTSHPHRLCRLIWKILNQGVRYDERGPWL